MSTNATVHIIDDDPSIRDSLSWLVESVGYPAKSYASAQAFLNDIDTDNSGCVVLDVRLKDMSGLDLQAELARRQFHLPVIIISGHADVHMAVQAMKSGAVDFLTKPFNDQELLETVQRALAAEQQQRKHAAQRAQVESRLATLTPRENDVLRLVVDGKMNKVIAAELGVSSKTVEAHRARVMEKMAARSLAELIQQVMLVKED